MGSRMDGAAAERRLDERERFPRGRTRSGRRPERGRNPRPRRLRRQQDQGPRGTRGGPHAARDVHRVHELHGSPPPRLRGRGQFGGRGAGRLLRPHRGRDPQRQLGHRGGQRPRHPGGHAPAGGEVGRGSGPDDPPLRREVRERRLQGLGRPARRRRLGRQRPLRAAHARDLEGRGDLRAGIRARQAGHRVPPDRRLQAPRHEDHLRPRPADLRGPRLLARHPRPEAPGAGLPEPRAAHRAEGRARREAARVGLPLRGRDHRVRPTPRQGAAGAPLPADLPRGEGGRRRARDRDAVERFVQRDDLLVRELDQHGGGGDPPRRLQGRADPHREQLPGQGEPRQGRQGHRAVRRGLPRGADRGDRGEDPEAAVRGPDKDQAGELGGQGAGRGAGQQPPRRVARRAPAGRAEDHPQDGGRRARPRGGAARPRADAAEGRPRVAARSPASSPTARSATRPSASCSWSRATRRAARPSRGATGGSRRSSRCAARS